MPKVAPKKTIKLRAKKPVVRKPAAKKAVAAIKSREKSNIHFDRLFLAISVFAFIAVGLTIVAIRSNNLYQTEKAAEALDATPLIFERHQDLSPKCGSDPMVTMLECNTD